MKEVASNIGTQGIAQRQKKSAKKPGYFYVDSDDENFDTRKDKFWKDVEDTGMAPVDLDTDLFSRIKEVGRAKKPTNLVDEFPKLTALEPTAKVKKHAKRREGEDKKKGMKRRRSSEVNVATADNSSQSSSLLLASDDSCPIEGHSSTDNAIEPLESFVESTTAESVENAEQSALSSSVPDSSMSPLTCRFSSAVDNKIVIKTLNSFNSEVPESNLVIQTV